MCWKLRGKKREKNALQHKLLHNLTGFLFISLLFFIFFTKKTWMKKMWKTIITCNDDKKKTFPSILLRFHFTQHFNTFHQRFDKNNDNNFYLNIFLLILSPNTDLNMIFFGEKVVIWNLNTCSHCVWNVEYFSIILHNCFVIFNFTSSQNLNKNVIHHKFHKWFLIDFTF